MPNPLKILPSIAAGNLLKLGQELEALEQAGADAIHFDCMDGHFVPLLTIGVPLLEQVRKATPLHLDVHIMVTNPDDVWSHYIDAGADTLTFQLEAARHAHRLCQNIRGAKKKAGVALNPATHWRQLEFLLPFLDQITVMAVNPGYSRQAHIPEMLKKVKELDEHRRQFGYSFEIQVDGGVQLGNIGSLRSAGADSVVAGGAIFSGSSGTAHYAQSIQELRLAAGA